METGGKPEIKKKKAKLLKKLEAGLF